ncbi:hypothetical protein [Uliginosibacterium sp. H1]|uniref:hypothetical protein n=1 Tax=Uliginosibacterium sp. H1 TaxID=3114757 RepID=UPI002E19F0FB|nr:hypothetical protein [Uliginosibacterium sp. H1]
MKLRRYALVGLLASVLLHLALLDYWRGQTVSSVNGRQALQVRLQAGSEAPSAKETPVPVPLPPPAATAIAGGRPSATVETGKPAPARAAETPPPAVAPIGPAEATPGFRPLNHMELPVSQRLALLAALVDLAPDMLSAARERLAARFDEQGRVVALGRDGEWLDAGTWQSRLGALRLPVTGPGEVEIELLPR